MQEAALKRPDPEFKAAPARDGNDELPDLRFRHLIGAAAWATLPDAVQKRFGKRLGPAKSVNYVGRILCCRMNLSGRILSQACRLIGAPLPLDRDSEMSAVVSVTEDGMSGGQIWTRIYARKRGFPQVIHSTKQFAGPTGLEEYLGFGIGIALKVQAIDSGIRFSSDHYYVQLGRLRLVMPRWLAPGRLTIEHVDQGDSAFAFTLPLQHPLLGEVMYQRSMFRDQSVRPQGLHHD